MLQRTAQLILRTSPSDLTRGERVGLVLACLLLVFGLLEARVLRLAWPELAVEMCLRTGDREDPWGHPWVNDLKQGFAIHCRSRGPNVIDEDGGGDDILGIAGELGFAIDEERPALSLLWGGFAWALAPAHVVVLGVLVAWAVVAGIRSKHRARETEPRRGHSLDAV